MSSNGGSLVSLPVGGVTLEGVLSVPEDATGLVVFAHGSGSSRESPRNNYVADVIRDGGVGTLLFDLLTEAEDQVRDNRFDIDLLTERLVAVTGALSRREDTRDLRVGYFGSSTGAAAALRGAARLGDEVGAVVSRGGRVDLASEVYDDVRSPTLLIVGGADTQVLELNREAYERLSPGRSYTSLRVRATSSSGRRNSTRWPPRPPTGSQTGCDEGRAECESDTSHAVGSPWSIHARIVST